MPILIPQTARLLLVLLCLLLPQWSFAKTITLSGHVVDSKGQIVKDARVDCFTEPPSGLIRSLTSDTGSFSLEIDEIKIDAKSACFLFVSAKGFAPVLLEVPAAAPATPLTITLAPGHRLEGRLIDETGKPIAGAQVSPQLEAAPGQLPGHIESCSRLLPNTTSGKDGSFLLSDLPADHISFTVEATGFAIAGKYTIPVDTSRTITIPRSRKISARMVRQRDGKPVTSFSVTIEDHGGGESHGMISSPDGTYLEYESAGEHHHGPVTLRIDAPGCMQTTVEHVVFSADAKPLLIRLSPAGKMVGKITERGSGKPLAGVVVSLLSEDDFLFGFAGEGHLDIGVPPVTTRTDAKGKFSVEARFATGTVTLQKPGYGSLLLQHVDLTAPLEVAMDKGATILGKNVGDDGKPLAGSVSIHSAKYHVPYFDGQTQADGSFTVRDVPAGVYWVEGGNGTTTIYVRTGETAIVDFHAATGTALQGTVTLSDGPGAGLSVMLVAPDEQAMYKTSTDQHGHYALSPHSPGEYLLYVIKDGNTTENAFYHIHQISLHTGDNLYDVARTCTVSGQLIDAENGKPLAQVALLASLKTTWRDFTNETSLLEKHVDANWHWISGAITDEQGHFTINNLMPGEWLITRAKDPMHSGPVVVPPFTILANERKTVQAVQPPLGVAEITVVDAQTGKAIPGVSVVCVDRWGNVIPSNRPFPSKDDQQHPITSSFPALPAGEYQVYPDRGVTETYPVTSVTFTATAGKTSVVQLPLTRGGRLHCIWPHLPKLNGTDTLVISYTLSVPATDMPSLHDAQGRYTGGILGILTRGTKVSDAYLALAPGTYHVELSTAKLNRGIISVYTPAPASRLVVKQNITIIDGKDTVVEIP